MYQIHLYAAMPTVVISHSRIIIYYRLGTRHSA